MKRKKRSTALQVSTTSFKKIEISEPQGESFGVVLLVHGLNLKPERMKSLGYSLNQMGMTTLNLHLTGSSQMSEFKKIRANTWREDVDYGISVMKRFKGIKAYLGFSLGGLLGLDSLVRGASFDHVFLFAPAVSLRPWTHLARFTSPLGSFVIPSGSSDFYRSHSGTPANAYRALFEIYKNVRSSSRVLQAGAVSGTVFLAKADELVHTPGVRDWFSAGSYCDWRILELDARKNKKSLNHVIIDKTAVGEQNWEAIISEIKRSLSQSPLMMTE